MNEAKQAGSRGRPRRYDAAYKRHAVELSERSDRTIREVARELGLTDDTLYSWRIELGVASPHGVEMPARSRSVAELEQENRELRAKLADMQARESILKKSLGILSESPRSGMPQSQR